VLGALGPKMRRRAALHSDGVLLSWLTPEIATQQAAEAHALSADAHVALYVRTAMEESALARLREESQRYAGYRSYAANFARLGMKVQDTVLGPDSSERLTDYRDGVDEVVLRAITSADTIDEYRRFIDGARALMR